MKIWKLEADKVFQEIEDLNTGGRNSIGIGTFIKRVQDDVDRALVRLGEHLFKTCDHRLVAGFRSAIIVCLINVRKNVAITVGISGELRKKGSKSVAEVSFIGVPEIEVEVGDRGLSGLLQRRYVLDDCRASWRCKFLGGEHDR